MLNLLLNSIQGIDGAGKIIVDLELRKEMVAISVSDTGRGIPSNDLSNIFRPFFTTKLNGTGLGLSLARRIVEEHEGRIDVTSTVGKGTKFTVFLPIERTVAAVPA